MASIGAAAFTVSPLDTTVTVGNDDWFDFCIMWCLCLSAVNDRHHHNHCQQIFFF
jgi:hypothetical protein